MENESSVYSAMSDSSFDDDTSTIVGSNLKVIPEYEELEDDLRKESSMIRWKKLSGSVLQTLALPVDDVPQERAPPTENFTVYWTVPKQMKAISEESHTASPASSRSEKDNDDDDDTSDSSSISMACSRRSSVTITGLMDTASSPVVWNNISSNKKRDSISDVSSIASSRPAKVDITNRVGWQPALGPDMFSLYKESNS